MMVASAGAGGAIGPTGGVRSETTRAGGSGFIGLPRGKPASAGTRTTRAGRGLGRLGRATADARDISGSTGGLPGGKGKSGGVGRRAGPDEEANAGGCARQLSNFPTCWLSGLLGSWEIGGLAGGPGAGQGRCDGGLAGGFSYGWCYVPKQEQGQRVRGEMHGEEGFGRQAQGRGCPAEEVRV